MNTIAKQKAELKQNKLIMLYVLVVGITAMLLVLTGIIPVY